MFKKILFTLSGFAMVFAFTSYVDAATFPLLKNEAVKVYTKQGGDWFKVVRKSTDRKGVLELDNVIPGKYKFEPDDDGKQLGYEFKIDARLLDDEGRRIKEEVDVDLYMYISDVKTYIGTVTTDEDGDVTLSSVYPGMTYEIDVTESQNLGKKDGLPRIKVKSKIGDSDWFVAKYTRLDENNILEMENVITGKYKFKYKPQDVTNPNQPFTLKMRVRDHNGKKVRQPVAVELWGYVNYKRVWLARMVTNEKGDLIIPNVVPGKYGIKILK